MTNRDKFGYRPIPLCDGHIHITFAHPVDTTKKILDDTMTWYNCERIAILGLQQDSKKHCDPGNNLKALYCKSRLNREYPDRHVYAFSGIFHHYDERDTAEGYLAQAKALYTMGFDGVKILDGKPKMRMNLGRRLDDPIFDPFYAFLEEHDIPVTMHLGDPPEFWDINKISEYALKVGWYCDETYPTLEEMREEVLSILDKFPRLRLTMAHFFFLSQDLEACADLFARYPTLCFDLTPGGEMFENFSKRPEEWRTFFIRYADRISLGTDTYNYDLHETLSDYGTNADLARTNLVRKYLEWTEPFEHPWYGTLIPLGLDADTLTKIYRGNFIRRLGAPRPVNASLTAETAKVMREAMADGTMCCETEERTALEYQNLDIIENYFKNSEE